MKNAHPSSRRRAGVVLPTVLVLMLTICLVVGLLARFSVRSMRLARRTLDVQRAFVAAESGLGYGVVRAKHMLTSGGVSGFYANYSSIQTPPTPDPEYELRLRVRPISASSSGSGGTTVSEEGSIEVVCGARHVESGVACALRVTIGATGESLSDYAVFYDGDLEANVGNKDTSLTFRGKIHANGNIYVSKFVTFERNVTCNGMFLHRRKSNMSRDDNNGQWRQVQLRFGDDNEGNKGDLVNTWNGSTYVDEEIGSEWVAQSLRYYGNAVQTGQNGIPKLSPPISVDDVQHALVEKPLPSTDDNYRAATETQKFANKAALTLHVNSDGTYTLTDNVHGTDITSSLKQAELYSPGYWKGTYGGGKEFTWPGWWEDAAHGYHGYVPKPNESWMENVEWVSRYTPPKSEDDPNWLSNYPGLNHPGDDSHIRGFMKFGASLDGYAWANSATNEVISSVANGDSSTGSWGAGAAKRVYYAKNPKTNAYIMKTKGGIQTVRKDPSDSAGVNRLGNLFYDSRQGYMMAPADIYLDEFLKIPQVKQALEDAPGGEAGIGKILYVEMDDPELVKGEKFWAGKDSNGVFQQSRRNPINIKSDGYPLPCVRIRNGSDPGTDLSIVTDLPVYVEGDFNTNPVGTDSDGEPEYRSTLIAGDRVTMLSNNWQDGNYLPCVTGMGGGHQVRMVDNNGKMIRYDNGGTLSTPLASAWVVGMNDPRRDAKTTTLNSILMTGIFPTVLFPGETNTEKGYSGGLENILRYLEDWTGEESRFHGSIICLWDTQKIDRTWESPTRSANGSGVYYHAPKRVWGYSRMTPPGMPGFFAVREATWERVAWSSVDWSDGSSGGGGEGCGEGGG